MTTNKEYLRDWPAAGELSEALMEQLERLAQGLLVHGVGLSVDNVDIRVSPTGEEAHIVRLGFVRYTVGDIRSACSFVVQLTTRDDTAEDIERFVTQIYTSPLRDGLPSVEEMVLGNDDAWTAWPEDGDARFGDENEEDEDNDADDEAGE